MYNTKLPTQAARPSLAYSSRLVHPATVFNPLPAFRGWVHCSGRIVLHRSVGTPRETTVAVVIQGKAWRVDSGPSAKARDLARRIELAVADIPQDLWVELDNRAPGCHPSSQRWGEFTDAFDRHNARAI